VTNPGEPYVIAWSAPARRAIAHVPEKAAAAISEFVYGALADNPHRVGRALRWELKGLHVARRGDYRIVYHLDTERRVIVIEALGHRSDIYRRR
jgi:mRNA-degrading endonuclease RelE of RelBE toxin-antitoxin system